jgi:RNase H-fold protein (predicted Holliday junction resolvase)
MRGGAVLGIDPGTRKVGFAITDDASSPPVALGIEPLETLMQRLEPLVRAHPIRAVALGSGTNVDALLPRLAALRVPIHIIDETDTTFRARALYFQYHPPKGWRRLLPIGLQVPPRPIDDYAALLIARRYIDRGGEESGVV